MPRSAANIATQRTGAIGRHFMSTSAADELTVTFESNNRLRRYILNRPSKLNALDGSMINLLRPKIEEWNSSDLCGTVVGTGAGRAFCAGGDVATVVKNASRDKTKHLAIDFFKQEFELDYLLATLQKPYVAILDGHTMGGGVGLTAHAPFRVATEKTIWAMPETKIGYSPDVGGSYLLSRLDGEIGTYLGLTGDTLVGKAVFEHGLATHFIPSRRVPLLLQRLAELEDPKPALIDQTIEELSSETEGTESQSSILKGNIRAALDSAFKHNSVPEITSDLTALTQYDDETVRQWATKTLNQLTQRSPTSLAVALAAIRRGQQLSLHEAFQMEMKIATAFCNGASPDFQTGVNAVLVEKTKGRPAWSPSSIDLVSPEIVERFFDPSSPYLENTPSFDLSNITPKSYPDYGLPTENEIRAAVEGSHADAGGMSSTVEDIQSLFERLRPGKHGVREKVQEVLERRCRFIDNADGNFVWLKWVPQ